MLCEILPNCPDIVVQEENWGGVKEKGPPQALVFWTVVLGWRCSLQGGYGTFRRGRVEHDTGGELYSLPYTQSVLSVLCLRFRCEHLGCVLLSLLLLALGPSLTWVVPHFSHPGNPAILTQITKLSIHVIFGVKDWITETIYSMTQWRVWGQDSVLLLDLGTHYSGFVLAKPTLYKLLSRVTWPPTLYPSGPAEDSYGTDCDCNLQGQHWKVGLFCGELLPCQYGGARMKTWSMLCWVQ